MRERREFAPYVRRLADMLRLSDWTMVIKPDAPDCHDASASIVCIEGRKRALLRFSEDFLRDPEEEQRHTLVHELIHCHQAMAMHIGGQLLGDRYPQLLLHLEYVADGLADAIAPLLPLPSDILDRKPEP